MIDQTIADGGSRIADLTAATGAYDEQRFIALLFEVREDWNIGVLRREQLSLLLSMCSGLVMTAISERQRAVIAARRVLELEAGQGLLPISDRGLRVADCSEVRLGARVCTPGHTAEGIE